MFFPNWYNKNQSPKPTLLQMPSTLYISQSLDRDFSIISRNLLMNNVMIL